MQREKLEQILIPYCTCLEETIEKIHIIYLNDKRLYKKEYFQQWWNNLNKPLEYLYASKRIYLSEKCRELLKEYKIMLNHFERKLENEYELCLIKYKNYLISRLDEFENVGFSMWIQCSMDKITEYKVKIAIVNKKKISLLYNIREVGFVHNDDFENHKETSIKLNDKFINTFGSIKYGVSDWDDIEDAEEELACILLEFIENEFIDEEDILINIFDNTSSGDLLRDITEKIEFMREKLISEIDKITQ